MDTERSDDSAESADSDAGDLRPRTEYRCGDITVRVPSEPPPVTPRVARALLEILRELTEDEFRKRSKDADS